MLQPGQDLKSRIGVIYGSGSNVNPTNLFLTTDHRALIEALGFHPIETNKRKPASKRIGSTKEIWLTSLFV